MAHRENGRRDVFDNATESITAQAASGNPLSVLSIREALVFLAKSRGLPMAGVARVLKGERADGSLSRERLYVSLRRAHAALAPMAANPALRPIRRCACGAPRNPGRRRCAVCWREHQRAVMRARRAVIEIDPDGG